LRIGAGPAPSAQRAPGCGSGGDHGVRTMIASLRFPLLVWTATIAPPADGPRAAVETARACVRRATAQPELARAWVRRIRLAGWLPELQTAVDRTLGTREAIDAQDGARYGAYALDDVRVSVRAIWKLDRLVFDPEELRASRESVRLAELRQELALS